MSTDLADRSAQDARPGDRVITRHGHWATVTERVATPGPVYLRVVCRDGSLWAGHHSEFRLAG